MNPLRRAVMWAVLTAVILLAVLSIYGAFLGAARAQAFFNSLPLAVYWLALTSLLIGGVILFRRLIRVPSLLLMHLACVLILAGAMWDSQAGQAIARKFFGIDRIREGRMPILERMQESRIMLEDSNDTRELPFAVRLKDFRMEYYKQGHLLIQSRAGQRWSVLAEPGRQVPLGSDLGKITIRRVFENFKIGVSGDEPVAYDAPDGSNPALEVATEKPDGSTIRRYVFSERLGHMNAEDPLTMTYVRTVSDYISEIEVVKDGQVVAAKEIEVNHPLHYGGYHFYQSSYGQNEFGEYAVLTVVSDSGLNLVYGGYMMLIAGISWHFWGRRILGPLRTRHLMAPGTDPPSERHE